MSGECFFLRFIEKEGVGGVEWGLSFFESGFESESDQKITRKIKGPDLEKCPS